MVLAIALVAVVASISVAVGQQGGGRGGGRGRGAGSGEPEPSILANGDFTIRPPWSNSNDLIWDNTIPHGTVHRFMMKSEDSKIYKGISREKPGEVVPYTRPVAVYIPAQYVPGTPAPVKDLAEARRWYRKAADAGDERSKKWLAEHPE